MSKVISKSKQVTQGIIDMPTRHFESYSVRSSVAPRLLAQLDVQASWKDSLSNEFVVVKGRTENVGSGSTLVTLDKLPAVGSSISLSVFDEEKFLVDVEAEVLRVERDPSRPLAALQINENLSEWNDLVISAAQDWTARKWQEASEEDWIN